MISVALCEDDALTLDILDTMVQDYGKQAHCPLKTTTFTTGSMLIQSLDKSEPFDIFILDYYMPFMNGVETAQKIREKGENGIVIFSTSSMDGVMDAFAVNTFRYLMKPMNKDTLAQVMDQAIEQLNKSKGGAYDIRTPDGVRKVKEDDIIFVEKNGRSLLYHMFDGEEIESTTIQGSVRNAVASLIEKSGFVMAGSSVALNMGRIESMSHGDIFFVNGDEITPPRREYAAIKAAWDEFGAQK